MLVEHNICYSKNRYHLEPEVIFEILFQWIMWKYKPGDGSGVVMIYSREDNEC